MLTPEERYQYDPVFRTLVDVIENHLRQADYTPSELRQAVILAAIHYEATKPMRYTQDISGNWIRRDE